MACLQTKLNFLANGCVLAQNARKETPFKIQFYCQDNINLLSAPFLNLINGICLFFLPHFHPLCFMLAGKLQPNFQIALTHSILKLKSILIPPDKMSRSGEKNAHFNSPQTKLKNLYPFEGPCSYMCPDRKATEYLRGKD